MRKVLENKWAILASCTAAIIALFVAMHIYLPEKPKEFESFRGIKWGSSIRELPELTFLAEDGNLKYYVRENDDLKLLAEDMNKIVYGFYKNQFYSVMLYYKSQPRFSKLKDAFSSRLGTPFQPDQSPDKCFWTADNLSVLLIYDTSSDEGRVSYFYQPLESFMEKDEKPQEQKNS
jgi:hypothetical protein